jgi:hypothetical protein
MAARRQKKARPQVADGADLLCWQCEGVIRRGRFVVMRSTDDLADPDPVVVHVACAILLEEEGWALLHTPSLFDRYDPIDATDPPIQR